MHLWNQQVIELHTTLHYLGVPIHEKSLCLVTTRPLLIAHQFLMPSSTNTIMHCPSIAFVWLLWLSSLPSTTWVASSTWLTSPASIHWWGYQQICHILEQLLFFHSDTSQLYDEVGMVMNWKHSICYLFCICSSSSFLTRWGVTGF